MNKKILIFSIIIIALFTGCNKNKDFCIHIIDVGQADSILITTQSNKNMLIDGGDENSAKIIKSYLKNKKVKTLDVVVATHPDSDHIGSLDDIIDNFDVEKIYLSKDDSFNLDKYTEIYVLSPDYITDNNNSNSIVLNISYKNNNFLFTGDCEESNEMDMINSYDLENIDFLKVAHHGSSTSSSLEFLKEISPSIAVISCGYKNDYGHPHRSTLQNLESVNAKVFRTDVNGSMQFYSDGNKIYSTIKYKQE